MADKIRAALGGSNHTPGDQKRHSGVSLLGRSGQILPVWLSKPAEVGSSTDLDRVCALPRRPAYTDDGDYGALAAALTAEFRSETGYMALRANQAVVLDEARRVGGVVGLLGVGSGKTLISLLLPIALGAERAALLLPSQLKAQLLQRSYPEMLEHWRLPTLHGASAKGTAPGVIYPVTYEELSRAKTARVLEELDPDVVVADEAHHLRRAVSVRTGRFLKFVVAACGRGSLRSICLLSGTLVRDSINDLAFVRWALGKYAPIPWDAGTLAAWAAALDPVPYPAPPGALLRLCDPNEPPRSGFRRRFTETPGVVATTASPLPTRLVLESRSVKVPGSVLGALASLRDTWTTPWGEEFDDVLDFSRYADQIALGFAYRRTWPRGEPENIRREWLEARSAWNSEIRSVLDRSRGTAGRADSPGLLEQAAREGRWASRTYARWAAVRDLAKPSQEPVWVDGGLVQDAVAWGRGRKGLIWTEYDAFGRAVAKAGGWPYVAGGAKGDRALSDLLASKGATTAVLSIPARGVGTDGLQRHYTEQLVTTPPAGGAQWEQLLGRLVRLGQDAPVVCTGVYLHTPEYRRSFSDARRDAAFLAETTHNHQKLCSADVVVPKQ
jgi:hypothetical protein